MTADSTPSQHEKHAAAGSPASGDDLAGVRPLLDELRARVAEISAREQELQRREAELNRAVQAARPNGAAEEDVDARRAEVDRLFAQASRTADEAQRRLASARRVQQQLEAREIELRRREVALVADAGGLSPTPQPETREAATESSVGLPFWARLLVPALVIGGGVFLWTTPRHEASATIAVTSDRDSGGRVLGDHLRVLAGAEPPFLSDAGSSEEWASAWRRGDTRVALGAKPGSIVVATRDHSREAAVRRLERALVDYKAYAATRLGDESGSTRLAGWEVRRDTTARELSAARATLDAIEKRLAGVESFAAWDEARGGLERTQTRLADVLEQHAAATRGRDELLSASEPRGVVAPESLAAALDADAVHREDSKELAAAARSCRVELAIAMLAAEEPLAALRSGVGRLEAVLVEQRDLQPPPALRAVLEQAISRSQSFSAELGGTIGAWGEARTRVERLALPAQLDQLPGIQTEAAQRANRTIALTDDFINETGRSVDAVASGETVGTRELVVASLVRGELSSIAESAATLKRQLAATDTASNFKLDAADRQVRALQRRLTEQRDRIAAELQSAADAEARAAHQAALAEFDGRIRTHDEARAELSRDLGRQLAEIQRIESETRELRMLGSERNAAAAAISRLESLLAQIDAEKPEITPDQVELSPIEVASLSGADRWMRAVVAGAAASAISWLVGFRRR